MAIRLDAGLFRLAYGAVATDPYRSYLGGVHVEPHPERGALLVSTDGHRMICIHDATADCDEQAIISLPKFVLSLCGSKKDGGKLGIDRRILEVDTKAQSATVVLEHISKTGEIERTDPVVTAHRVTVDGSYPDWRRVTPKEPVEPSGLSGFNPKFLAALGNFGAEIRPGKTSGMYFLRSKGSDDLAPVIVRWGGVENVFAILMPMRTDFEPKLPSFLAEPASAIAAE